MEAVTLRCCRKATASKGDGDPSRLATLAPQDDAVAKPHPLDTTRGGAHERDMMRAIAMANKRAALFGAGRLRA